MTQKYSRDFVYECIRVPHNTIRKNYLKSNEEKKEKLEKEEKLVESKTILIFEKI